MGCTSLGWVFLWDAPALAGFFYGMHQRWLVFLWAIEQRTLGFLLENIKYHALTPLD